MGRTMDGVQGGTRLPAGASHRLSTRACRDFRWPEPTHFNWALDWFDAELARGDSASRPALTIVGDGATSLSFAELSERSNRLANALRALGVKRGDRVLLMLGNVAPLWETMLAAMKLGAVVIPAATLLTPDDLADRFERGRARHVVTAAGRAPQVRRLRAGTDADRGRRRAAGLASLRRPPDTRPPPSRPTRKPMPTIRCCSTSPRARRRSRSWCCIRTAPIRSAISSTMFVIGLLPGDVHLNVASPGWAKHAWSCFFAPWNAGATVCVVNQPRFDAKALLGRHRANG